MKEEDKERNNELFKLFYNIFGYFNKTLSVDFLDDYCLRLTNASNEQFILKSHTCLFVKIPNNPKPITVSEKLMKQRIKSPCNESSFVNDFVTFRYL